MKKILLAAVAFAVPLGAPVFAADMPARAPVYKAAAAPVFNWTGAYAGIQGGWGWGDLDRVESLINPTQTGHLHGDGGLAGGTLGYNCQSSNWVVGVEADYAWSDIRVGGHNATVFPLCTNGGIGTCGAKLENFGTVRGRLGYAVDRVLFYGTAGLGFGDLKGFVSQPFFGSGSSTKFSTGFVYGGGIEAIIVNNWSAKIEYLHYDAGDSSKFQNATVVVNRADDWSADIVRVGLNYKFGY